VKVQKVDTARLLIQLCRDPHAWTRDQVRVWARAQFRCEYCGRDMLASAVVYDTGELDHIDPKRSRSALWNLALACRLCNRIKRRFRPTRMPNPKINRLPLSARSAIISRKVSIRSAPDSPPFGALCGVAPE
jgi:5-methylcytosine-specific restriction endonuclease McrA